MLAALLGIGSGVYIFDPMFRQYAIDSRGTMDPAIANAGAAGGLGGGVNDSTKVIEEEDKVDKVRKDKVVENFLKEKKK